MKLRRREFIHLAAALLRFHSAYGTIKCTDCEGCDARHQKLATL